MNGIDQSSLFLRFGIALVIGVLIGMQREYAFDKENRELISGVRTFALMALLGSTVAYVADITASPLPIVAAVIILGALFVINFAIESKEGEPGITTEVAALLTVFIGVLAYWNKLTLAAALGVTIAVILSIKPELHQFTKKITREDVWATLKFAVITAIILPVLPNENMGFPPFDVLNPYKIWLLVILISGISFVGYLLIKIVGTEKAIGLTGLFGGLASSTALTMSFSRLSHDAKTLARPFALAIIVAWAIMYPRVMVEVAALNIELTEMIILPLLAPVTVGLIYCWFLYRSRWSKERPDVSFSNPFELKPALTFGLIFAVILLFSKAAQVYLGDAGIYISSTMAGLADVDAIALSLAALSSEPEGLALNTAARSILLATAANTAVKGSIVLFAGTGKIRRAILPGFLLILAANLLAVLFI
ncbi:MAG: MgtC/SapB family protein [Spirochaetota bacterium]|nr:MgtC/SapB family protein [Spirochaetota bacterium]